jgi:hypothetical protein
VAITSRVVEISNEFATKEGAGKELMVAERQAMRKLEKKTAWKKPLVKRSMPPGKNTSATRKRRQPWQ